MTQKQKPQQCGQASSSAIPDGPDLLGLFSWHKHNAQILMGEPDLRSNFRNILTQFDRIILHENFAGTGNAAMALMQQFTALKNMVLDMEDQSVLASYLACRSLL